MFNVRPDQLWPWIRFKPPSDDPPGFRMAADGSIRDAGNSGPGFPGYSSSTNPSAPFDTGFGNAYRATGSGFDGHGSRAGLIPSFGSGSLPPFATSLLFPWLTEPQTMWPGTQGYVGEPEARPDTSVPGLHHFKPPPDDPSGFRVAADGSVRNGSPSEPNFWPMGYDPHADVTLPTGVSSDALRPFRDTSNPFDLLGQQRANTGPIPSFDGGSLPPHATSFLFPQMAEPQSPGRACWMMAASSIPDSMAHSLDSVSSHRQTSHRRLAFPATIRWATTSPTTSTSPLSDTIPLPASRPPSTPVPLAEFIRSS